MKQQPQHRSAGFTVLESSLAGSILGIVLLAGVVVSGSTVRSTEAAMRRSDTETRYARAAEELVSMLTSAGVSTLQAIPTGKDLPEDMVDDVVYDHLFFRRVVSYSFGEPVYQPATGKEPCELWFELKAANPYGGGNEPTTGALMYSNGVNTEVLLDGVVGMTFQKNLRSLSVEIFIAGDAEQNAESLIRFTVSLRSR